jgi:hypothetical protein
VATTGGVGSAWAQQSSYAASVFYACARLLPGVQQVLVTPLLPQAGATACPPGEAAEVAMLHAMAGHLQQARQLLGQLQPVHLACLSGWALINLAWAWVALFPPRYAEEAPQAAPPSSPAPAPAPAPPKRGRRAAAGPTGPALLGSSARLGPLLLRAWVQRRRSRQPDQERSQLALVLAELEDRPTLGWGPTDSAALLATMPKDRARVIGGTETSSSQKEVAQALQALGWAVELEAALPGAPQGPAGPYRTNVLVSRTPWGAPCCVAVVFDGPMHYLKVPARVLGGPTILRNRQLVRRVSHLLCVPWWEWQEHRDSPQAYLEGRLQAAGLVQGPASLSAAAPPSRSQPPAGGLEAAAPASHSQPPATQALRNKPGRPRKVPQTAAGTG